LDERKGNGGITERRPQPSILCKTQYGVAIAAISSEASSKSRKQPFSLKDGRQSDWLVKFWFLPFLEQVLPFFVNLLSIHGDFLGSADADSYFLSCDCYDRYTNIGANNDFFPDFS
jgi:hypothetical protein